MESRALQITRDRVALNSLDSQPQLKELLQQLLDCVDRQSETIQVIAQVGSTEEILLDFYMGGDRYVLMRFQCNSPQLQITLSPREQEIARLVAKGFANKTIAVVLDISSWTVATHMRRIFSKLGVNSRAEMVAQMMRGNRQVFNLDD